MSRQRILQPKYKQSVIYKGLFASLQKLITKLNDEKNIPHQKLQHYIRTFKSIESTLAKIKPNWPEQIENRVDDLRDNLISFQNRMAQASKGSNFFCVSSGNPKQLDKIYQVILTYQQFFHAINIYQKEQQKEIIVNHVNHVDQKPTSDKETAFKAINSIVQVQSNKTSEVQKKCKYCELLLSVSLCPNGYIAKKLINELPNTQWIAGILYEQGIVVDKDIQKAIYFYEKARQKGNPQAIYRLGSLNERNLYGKSNQYIQMWQQSSKMNHLQSLTDMGFLYQNGLYDQLQKKQILAVNEQKALEYYMRASEKTFPRALNNLATFYFNSKRYKDVNKCLQYLQKAGQNEYAKSLHNLALMHMEGNFTKKDQIKGMNLVKRAAQKGDAQARVLYIKKMLNDITKCKEQDFHQLHKYCRQLIAKDEEMSEPYSFLGIMAQKGYGTKIQPKIALLYFTVAASYQSQAALLKLGDCYRNGFGVQKDYTQAIKYYEKASKALPIAFVYIGQIYEQGSPQLTVNYEKAFQYYHQAQNKKVQQAFVHIGNMYLHGRYVVQDQEKARQYFLKAKKFDNKQNVHNQQISQSFQQNKTQKN